MEEFQRLRAGPKHPFRKVPPGAHFSKRATACCRRLRPVKRGRAAELRHSEPSPHILSDLKYSILSLFDTATRIYLFAVFSNTLMKMDLNIGKNESKGMEIGSTTQGPA